MHCPQCGFENPPGFGFCGRCGQKLTPTCPTCGADAPPGFAFCGRCGARLAAASPAAFSQTDLDQLRRYLPRDLIEAVEFERLAPPPRLLEQCLARLDHLVQICESHLPYFLVERLRQDPTPGQVGGQFIQGALLFADISGFTAMSERLSRSGREGAEEVTGILNSYFDAMLAILRAYGGQLIQFGGDALLGLFTEPASVVRAAQAALEMQAAMAGFAQTVTSQGTFPLQMKVSLRRGRFFAAQLGAAQSMEYALFGRDVNACAEAASHARAGEIVLDAATLAALNAVTTAAAAPLAERPDTFTLGAVGPVAPPPSPSPAALPSPLTDPLQRVLAEVRRLNALTPYLPAGLLARLAAPGEAWQGEHRLVAVLFANVHGLGELADRLGPGRESEIIAGLNGYFTAMQRAIHSFGGVINKIDLSDHGDKLLAFFGAPIAHEDDAERAVRAALAMQTGLKTEHSTFDLQQQIGLSYGYVFAGYVGAQWRHEYTVMGDEVNLAARLMATATAGEVATSDAVRRKVKALFELEPRGEVKLKGKSAPQPVFRVIGERAIPEPVRGLEGIRSPLVGRETEWRQLVNALEQARLGRGQIVRVMGEAGLGKSRLVSELRRQAGDLRWVEGRCLSYTERVSFYPFLGLIRQFSEIRTDDSAEEAWAKIRRLVETLALDDADSTAVYLAHFLSLPLAETQQARIRYLDAEALQRRTFVALRALFEAAAVRGGPLVLVFEDIHWIDRASIALLDYLLPLVNRLPLLVILLYRPEREAEVWRMHESVSRAYAHCTVDISLAGLTPEDSERLLSNLAPLEGWPPTLKAVVLSRAEGNPLYVEEVLRVLMDEGALTRAEDGSWQVNTALDTIRVPDTLQGVMMTRLDRLEEEPRRAAQVSAVVGRTVPFTLLSHLTAADRAALNLALVRLQQHEIVRESQRVPELVYAFRHALMREVCYESLLARARRELHRQIAAYLEANLSDSDDPAPLIAHHAYLGQDWPRAMLFQWTAGQKAQRLFALQEAADHFHKALECAQHLPPDQTLDARLLVHLALGELLTTAGRYDEALNHLNAARALGRERGDPNAEAKACRWLARWHELRGQYPAAFDFIRDGLAALDGRETAEAAQLRLIAGLMHIRQGENDKALAECQTALRIAEELGEVTALARAHNLLGVTWLRRNSQTAVEHFQRAQDLYLEAGDLQGQATADNLLANAYLELGRWPDADRAYREARRIFDQIGDRYNRAVADNNLGEVALKRGDIDGALSFYRAALETLEESGSSPWMLGALNTNLGGAYIRRGDAVQARQHLEAARRYFEQAGARDFLPELHRHRARAALIAGEPEAAEAEVRTALALARELSNRLEEGCSLRVQGEIALEVQRAAEALGPLRESVRVLEEVADEYELARSRFSLARAYAAAGRRAEALAQIERAVGVFERLEAAMDLAAARRLRETLDASPP